jgi:hypothetical protein
MGILNFLTGKGQPIPSARAAAVKSANTSGHGQTGELKAMDTETFLASDDKAWILYLGQAVRPYRKPGISVKQEYDLWLAARTRQRAIA